MSVRIGRANAQALDAQDSLAPFRDRFVEPGGSGTGAGGGPPLIYLDGNSLGRLPRATQARLAHLVAEEWADGLVRSWETWMDLPTRVGDLIAETLLGARPGEVGGEL